MAARAEAQPEVAAAHFARGVEAARAHAWEDAEVAFLVAYEASHRAPVLLNLAAVRRERGSWVGAADAYHRFLRTAPEVDLATHWVGVARELAALQLTTPTLEIELPDGYTALLDGAPVVPGSQFAVDPGTHALNVRLGEVPVRHLTLELREQERRHLRLTLSESTPGAEPSGTNQWWIWALAVGVGVVLAGTVAAVALSQL